MIRKILIHKKMLKNIFDNEFIKIINNYVFHSCKIIKQNQEVLLFSKLSLNLENGNIHIYNEKDQQKGIYVYSVSQLDNIDITIKDEKTIDGSYIKTIERGDTLDVITIIYSFKGDANEYNKEKRYANDNYWY